jgi:hypothetical protein
MRILGMSFGRNVATPVGVDTRPSSAAPAAPAGTPVLNDGGDAVLNDDGDAVYVEE